MMEVLEEKTKIVIYYGRFQPPHILHKKVYDHLIEKFGSIYIGMSNIIEKERSPLSFDERKFIWETTFGINESRILQTNKTYSSLEIKDILMLRKPYHFICAVSEKDSERLVNGKYYKKYNDNIKLETSDLFGYYYIIPEFKQNILNETISGTHIRNLIKNHKDDLLLPYYDKATINMMRNRIL